VAAPKSQAREPIQLDVILLCRKRSFDPRRPEPSAGVLAKALAKAVAKAARLGSKGLELSRNDRRVILYSQFLAELGRSILLAETMNLKPVTLPEAALEERARRYEGDKLWTREAGREEARLKRVAAFRRILVDGPVLDLPLAKQQMSFNPSQLVPLEGKGTIYPTPTSVTVGEN